MLSRNLHVSHANRWWPHLATLDIPVLHYTFTVCVWVNKQPCCDLTRWAPHVLPCSLAEMFCRRLRWMEVRGQFHIRPHCYWGKRFQYFLSRRLLEHPLTLWRKFTCPCLESNQPRFFCSTHYTDNGVLALKSCHSHSKNVWLFWVIWINLG